MSEVKQRKTYSKEFKLDVIQQSHMRENIQELAVELGINPETIYRWRREYKDNESESFPGQGVPRESDEQKELNRIKKENADLRMERDILKKAIGIFSKKPG
ncbi:MAG: transposase [Balneolaceae bacterium]